MCNIGGGANRCDAHWGESQKAADLAKRRAKYAALKGGTVREYTHKEATSLIAEAKTSLKSAEHFKIKAISDNNHLVRTPKGNPSASKLKINGEQEYNEKLGLHSVPLEGSFVKQGYYADRTIEGVANWNNLDEESYKEFGFTHPSEERGLFDMSLKTFENRSTEELSLLTLENKQALAIFTSSNYLWINEALYNKNENQRISTPSLKDQDVSLTFKDTVIAPKLQTAAQLAEIVKQIDNAMEKSVGQQRIVYRGVSKRFLGDRKSKSVEEAISNYKLGQEMVFDGYQSATHSPTTAITYGNVGVDDKYGGGGILYEIRASSGINITNKSKYGFEKEVLLPRNARYMVVGIHKAVNYEARDSTAKDGSENSSRKNAYVVQLVEITEKGEVASADKRPASPPPLTAVQMNEQLAH